MSTNMIFELYRHRYALLSHQYTKSQDELDAILYAFKNLKDLDSRWSPQIIKKIYNLDNSPTDGDAALEYYLGSFSSSKTDFTLPNYKYDEYSSIATTLVDQHRDLRYFNRVIAYEAPLLAKYKKPYKKMHPVQNPIVIKYNKWIGEENHPLNSKISVYIDLDPFFKNLKFDKYQKHKFLLLISQRYNFDKNQLKFSCNKFSDSSQNVKYSIDIIKNLIRLSKSDPQQLYDLPLDNRYFLATKLRKRKNPLNIAKAHPFPEEWKRLDLAPTPKTDLIKQFADTFIGRPQDFVA
ncbi:mitochondrial 37S ribosomal protein mS35 ASCRUDRAFT_14618 [Ascoidea rubescens DSM 1968]|uniref:Small ribosomal subunit protein mS35 mitochondrial conserved domain-containing protein n=1 Tax=Ascoidea rubescens DSM 1968 TaxID=1344418 RepID=A0A1D2VDB3_9ASCO|nr:hypothetical protein ASCRUDRAFT_14618 [Ascoidea rubescens DSM 1968]ODV59572.1 hypothetical protein ASCRUDRAFT_14618 [Ascoidea rubescens DSM 1968]